MPFSAAASVTASRRCCQLAVSRSPISGAGADPDALAAGSGCGAPLAGKSPAGAAGGDHFGVAAKCVAPALGAACRGGLVVAAGGGGLVVVAAGGGGMAAGACHGGGLAARFAPCSVARLASRSMAKFASLSKAASSRIRCTVAACSASTMLLAWGDLS